MLCPWEHTYSIFIQCPQRLQGDIEFFETGTLDVCKVPCGIWDLNLGKAARALNC